MKILLSAQNLQLRVAELAEQINRDYNKTPLTVIGVLTGALLFVADLIRGLHMPIRLGFVQASSYRGTATEPGSLEINPRMLPDLSGRHVLLVDDILDTGQTLHHLLEWVNPLRPASVRVAVLLRKVGRQQKSLQPDYCGFEIPDTFVVGYGLDFDDQFRQLPYIAELAAQS
jgi:hypoxanthine phosphoribosyltransferase